jgi:hypothetical protein
MPYNKIMTQEDKIHENLDDTEEIDSEEEKKEMFKLVEALEFKVSIGFPLTEDETEFILNVFFQDDFDTVYLAAQVLMTLEKDEFMEVIDNFDDYSPIVQVLLIPFFATTNFNNTYVFLFELLKRTDNKDSLDTLIIDCLSRTGYFVFPILLLHLSQADYAGNYDFLIKLKRLLLKIGFENIRPYLAVIPEIPNEKIFRDLFGDENINRLKES